MTENNKDLLINNQDNEGKTALHYSILSFSTSNNYLPLLLIDYPGIDINVRDNKGQKGPPSTR